MFSRDSDKPIKHHHHHQGNWYRNADKWKY